MERFFQKRKKGKGTFFFFFFLLWMDRNRRAVSFKTIKLCSRFILHFSYGTGYCVRKNSYGDVHFLNYVAGKIGFEKDGEFSILTHFSPFIR